MIIYNMERYEGTFPQQSAGIVGENLVNEVEFMVKGFVGENTSASIHLRFANSSVNSVVPQSVETKDGGTHIVWKIGKNDIFCHGRVEVQLEIRDGERILQTEIIGLFAGESLLIEDRAYQNPNSETLALRDEIKELFKMTEEQNQRLDESLEIIESINIDSKEDKSNKVVSKEEISVGSYPSIEYLNNYYYDYDEVDSFITDIDESKADKADTLAGYGIEDAYTRSEIDYLLENFDSVKAYDTYDEFKADEENIEESKFAVVKSGDKRPQWDGHNDNYVEDDGTALYYKNGAGEMKRILTAEQVEQCVRGFSWDFAHKFNDRIILPHTDGVEQSLTYQIKSAENHIEWLRKEIENTYPSARYGVSFGGSANSGATVQRLYNAVGLTAEVGTDTVKGQNDFDKIYPWSARRRCCGYFGSERGNPVSPNYFYLMAYEGEPGFKTDGSNGNVWIEHSLFFYKHTVNEDGAEEIVISPTQREGYKPAPIFVNPDGSISEKAYTAAYPLATVDGLATSRSGVFPDVCSLNTAMTSARTLGENFTVTTMAEWYTECLYMWVEFATRNLQTVMKGATYMAYNSAHTAVIAETGVNRIIVANAAADEFVVGQTIGIGTALNDISVADNRIVTAIEAYDSDNKAISFDGSAVDISVGNVVYSRPWKNGSCDSVISSSGSFMSNTSGKYNCVYRGKESPYGNINERICDILLKREGEGTDENPYTYDVYFLSEPEKYSRGRLTADYTKLNINIPNKDGYIKKLGYDSRFPFVRIPTEIGASSTTYYSDYYQNPDKYQWLEKEINAFRCGGSWNGGEQAGMNACTCYHTPSDTNAGVGARISHRGGN